MKLQIKIRVEELDHIKIVTEKLKDMGLEKIPHFNIEVIIEMGC